MRVFNLFLFAGQATVKKNPKFCSNSEISKYFWILGIFVCIFVFRQHAHAQFFPLEYQLYILYPYVGKSGVIYVDF